jgi:hypothetical protein
MDHRLRISRLLAALAFVSCAFASCAPDSAGVELGAEPAAEASLPEAPLAVLVLADRAAPLRTALPAGALKAEAYGPGRFGPDSPGWRAALAAAEEESLKAVVAVGSPLGTVGLFEVLREARPELILVSEGYPDDALAMQAAADLVVGLNPKAWAESATRAVLAMEAGGLILSGLKAPGPSVLARRDALRAALEARGLSFAFVELGARELRLDADALARELTRAAAGAATAAESASAGGAAARPAIGTELSELSERLLYAALDEGLSYLECAPPPLGLRYGGAEGPAELARALDALALARGARGRAAFWPGRSQELLGAALAEHAFAAAAMPLVLRDEAALLAALKRAYPYAAWSLAPYHDPDSGVRARNHILYLPGAYAFGRGFLPLP